MLRTAHHRSPARLPHLLSCAGQQLRCSNTCLQHPLPVAQHESQWTDAIELVDEMQRRQEAIPPQIAVARELFRKGQREHEAYRLIELWYFGIALHTVGSDFGCSLRTGSAGERLPKQHPRLTVACQCHVSLIYPADRGAIFASYT